MRIYNLTKKFFIVALVIIGLIAVLPKYNFVNASSVNYEEINLLQLNSDITSVSSSSFEITFDVTSSDSSNGLILSTGNILNVYQNAYSKKAISSVEFYSNSLNITESILTNSDVVSHKVVYDTNNNINESVFVAEYINVLVTSSFDDKATFEVKQDTTISKIRIFYEEYEELSDLTKYIILDFNKGTITFNGSANVNINSNYKYSVVNSSNQTIESGTYNDGDKVYIIQMTTDSVGNNIRYTEAIDNYRIIFNNRVTCDFVLDNIWSSFVSEDGSLGGLHIPTSADENDTYRKKVIMRLKGVNIFSRISYYTGGDIGLTTTPSTSSLKITSFYGDGSEEGTLIAIGKQSTKYNDVHGSLAMNGWHSVIGGSDGSSRVTGFEIAGGTILAVSTAKDQCSAIGAGGNGACDITISGGNITAISYTTGTAIGGGIGHRASGGSSKIKITGGVVNAYNLGQPYVNTFDPGKTLDVAPFVPGTAIGGGSSYLANGNSSNVTITSGIVNAYSNGGSGLGGGNSIVSTGGTANINITGGNVTSYGYVPEEEVYKIGVILNNLQTQVLDKIEKGGTIINSTIAPYDYGQAGSGIGGGSGQAMAGGSATINISGGFLDASSIGGGNSRDSDGAFAKVTVTGGTIDCGSIGGGYSVANGFAVGTVIITGGSLDTSMSALPTNGVQDEMLFLTRISVLDNDNNKIINRPITSLTTSGLDLAPYNGIYGINDMVSDEDGMIYLWLPKNAAVIGGVVLKEEDKEVILGPHEEPDNMISAYEIGILKETDNSMFNHYVNTVSSEYYTLYRNYDIETGKLSKQLPNTSIVSTNTIFTMFIEVHGNFDINAYYGVESSTGKKTFQLVTINPVIDKNGNSVTGLYSLSITIMQNTFIVFSVQGDSYNPYYFILDLYDGDINVTEGETGYIIEQNGYILTGFSGDLYVTSGGVAAPNNINISIGSSSTMNLYVNNIIIGSDDSCLSINSGIVVLETGDDNDIIQSSNNSAIFIEENAKLIINADTTDALQIFSNNPDISPISGKGTLEFNNHGGYYEINSAGDKPQISVGIYEFSGNKTYSAELFIDEFEFDLIGYIDSKDYLNDVSISLEGNTDDFAARGVYKVLTSVSSPNSTNKVVNGNFITTLSIDSINLDAKIGTIEIIAQYSKEVQGIGVYAISLTSKVDLVETYTITYTDGTTSEYYITRSSDSKTCTLEIEGKAFIAGNIMIFAAAEGEIPYQIISYNGVYDAEEHGISVAVNESKFLVYYSAEVELNESNYLTEGSTTCPTYINVTTDEVNGYIRIYVYIIAGSVGEIPYNPVASSGTVTITKGENEWKQNLTCSDIPYHEGQMITPKPSALAKWGTVKYLYYDSDNNLLTEPISFEKGKTYQVRAYVEADDNGNYDAIQTNYTIKFKVVELKVFTSNGKDLNIVSGTATSLQITPNGAFSILYHITYSDGLAIKISNNTTGNNLTLPVGTKLTFINFATQSGVINQYYFYYVKEDDNKVVNGKTEFNIALSEFIKMGTSDEKFVEPSDSKEVELQFCIEFTKNNTDNTEITFTLEDNFNTEYQSIIINKALSNKLEELYITNEEIINEEANSYEFDVEISANKNEVEKILAVEVKTLDLTGVEVKLLRNNGTIVINPTMKINGLYFFKLTSNKEDVNNVYKLVVSNYDLYSKSIDLIVDLRSSNTNFPYILEGELTSNHYEINSINFTKYESPYIEVVAVNSNNQKDDSKRLVTGLNESIKFKFLTNLEEIDYEQIDIKVYVKEEGVYTFYADSLFINGSIIIPNDWKDGSYRFVFSYNGVTTYCSIVILRS